MSEIVVSGIVEKNRLVTFAETFAAKVIGEQSELVSEIKLHISGDGFHATAVDAANVAMVGPVTLAPRAFEAFDAPGSVTVGVNLTALVDRIDPADTSQLVEYGIDMETRHMNLRYGSADVSLALIDPDAIRQEPDISDLDLPNEVALSGEQLDHALTVTDMVSDHVFIDANPDDREIVFRGEGDTDDATVAYSDEEVADARVDESTTSVFSLAYMKALAKPIPDDAEVTIRFGDEFPARLTWDAFDGAFDVQQTLAPRIQSR